MSSTSRALLRLALVLALAPAWWPVGAGAQESRFSGIAQLDLTNAYFFRGLLNEKRGAIVQPWGELYANLYASDEGLIRDVTAGVGVWLSIHSKETLALNDPTSVYEADYYPLLSVDFAGGVNLLTVYYFYDSPNGAWDEAVQELNFKLSYDDSEGLGLSPWVNVAIETFSSSSGTTSGTGIQLGVAPTFYEGDRFSLSGSAELGLTTGDYYDVPGYDGDESAFGYANLGVGVGVPINDTFSAGLGFKYYFFGDETEFANAGKSGHGVVMGSLTAEF
jgi:hypothetical protein